MLSSSSSVISSTGRITCGRVMDPGRRPLRTSSSCKTASTENCSHWPFPALNLRHLVYGSFREFNLETFLMERRQAQSLQDTNMEMIAPNTTNQWKRKLWLPRLLRKSIKYCRHSHLGGIRESRRKLKNEVSVVKSLDRVPILLNMRNSIVEQNLPNAVCVSKLIPDLQGLLSIRVLNRNIMNLIYMTMLLLKAQALGLIKKFKQKKTLHTWWR